MTVAMRALVKLSIHLHGTCWRQLRELKERWEQLLAEKEYLQGRMQKLSFDMEEIKAMQNLKFRRSLECTMAVSCIASGRAHTPSACDRSKTS